MKTGIQVSSLKPLLTTREEVAAAFARLRALEVDTVQLQWIDKSVPIDCIAAVLRDAGLRSVSVQDFSQSILEDPGYYYALNRATGGTWLCPSRVPAAMELPQFAAALERMAADSGQRVCFHPVAADFVPRDGKCPVEFLLEQLPWLEVCFDLYHLHKAGLPMASWLRRYAGRVCMVHFKEGKRLPDGSEVLVPAGQGDIDWTGVVECCLETGVPYAFVEQERWAGDPYDRLREALDWLQGKMQ